ncbi:MAG: phosphatase PAP2 family protein [Aeriscardovia sp.]|nr:phosphatase PAP2 family protein [Aeriscardovia sp.]
MLKKINDFFHGDVGRLVLIAIVLHTFTYFGTRLFTTGWYHYNMTTGFDNSIPFLPWTVGIYLGCYIFWAVNYMLGCTQDKENAMIFMWTEIIAKTICLVCYVVIPTTNVRPLIEGTGIFETAMLWLYSTDAADNLFPSIHCLSSWLCVIAVRNQERIPKTYKVISVILAILVCISTLTTKQHVIVDVLGGVLLAELSYKFAPKVLRLTQNYTLGEYEEKYNTNI